MLFAQRSNNAQAHRAYRAKTARGGLAGAEGFEPPLAVLETAGLPLNLRPYIYLAHNPKL
jgi:hypothetical protein